MTTTARRGSDTLSGKRAVVIGGARGIGGEIATRFADEGARVSVLDRLVDCGSKLAADIGADFHEVDLADPHSARSVTEAAVGALGGVDILVNSAGILRLGPLLDTTTESWDEIFSINTRAMLTTMQVAARSMLDAGHGGTIINIASMAAKKGGANEGAYAASKAAVVALTRVAALEWGCHGITANAVCPGYILTEMGADTRTEKDVETWASYSPLGRIGRPSDVAGVALFLASTDAGYLTGQAINVTGGMVMH